MDERDRADQRTLGRQARRDDAHLAHEREVVLGDHGAHVVEEVGGGVREAAADRDEDGLPFYGSLSLRQAAQPQLLLAYEMNGQPLSIEHGAPLRLKVPNQLGYKSTKYIERITLVADLAGLGRGKGGYWEDAGYEHWAGF